MPDTAINTNDHTAPKIYNDEGARKAYLCAAQSAAIAIQDAVDNMRQINAISNTIIGVAMAQQLENSINADAAERIINNARKMSSDAAADFEAVSRNAANLLKDFPSGQ